MAPSHTVSPGSAGCGHGSARCGRCAAASCVERRVVRGTLRGSPSCRPGSATMAVAHEERLLGRLDQPVDMRRSLRPRVDAEPVEQREDHQRGEALRRRRQVEELRAAARCTDSGVAPLRLMRGEVRRASPARRAAPDRPRSRAPSVAAIEIVRPVLRRGAQRARQRGQLHQARLPPALCRRCRKVGKARRVFQFGAACCVSARAGSRVTAKPFSRRPDRILEQVATAAACRRSRAELERLAPARDRARDRVGRERAARRESRCRPALPVEVERRRRRAARRRRRCATGSLAGLAHQPEAVAADGRHVRVDDGEVAAIATVASMALPPSRSTRRPASRGQMMGRRDHAAAGAGSIQHSGLLMGIAPMFWSSNRHALGRRVSQLS